MITLVSTAKRIVIEILFNTHGRSERTKVPRWNLAGLHVRFYPSQCIYSNYNACNLTRSYTKPQTWTDPLDERPKRRNMDMRLETWNVRSLYRAGSLMTVLRELSRYRLDLVGAQEVR
jgi:hypothetical protein